MTCARNKRDALTNALILLVPTGIWTGIGWLAGHFVGEQRAGDLASMWMALCQNSTSNPTVSVVEDCMKSLSDNLVFHAQLYGTYSGIGVGLLFGGGAIAAYRLCKARRPLINGYETIQDVERVVNDDWKYDEDERLLESAVGTYYQDSNRARSVA